MDIHEYPTTHKPAGKSKASTRVDIGPGMGVDIYPQGRGQGTIPCPYRVDIPIDGGILSYLYI